MAIGSLFERRPRALVRAGKDTCLSHLFPQRERPLQAKAVDQPLYRLESDAVVLFGEVPPPA